MKKILFLIILSLFSLSTSSHANDKSVFECKSIVSNEMFNFFYKDINPNKDGFIIADRIFFPGEKYSRILGNQIWWYFIFDEDDANTLIVNVLDTRHEPPKDNFGSFQIHFTGDYTKKDFNELNKVFIKAQKLSKEMGMKSAYIQAEEEFFAIADNFFRNKVKFGKESYDKGNWSTLERAICEYKN